MAIEESTPISGLPLSSFSTVDNTSVVVGIDNIGQTSQIPLPAITRPLLKSVWLEYTGSYGGYDASRADSFGLNGLWLTEEQAIKALKWRQIPPHPVPIDNVGLPTNLWVANTTAECDCAPDCSFLFRDNALEIIRVSSDNIEYGLRPSNAGRMFRRIANCQKVLGSIDLSLIASFDTPMFESTATRLQNINIRNLRCDFDISMLPALSFDSLYYMVQNRRGTNHITIKVSKEAYTRWDADDMIANIGLLLTNQNISIVHL